MTARSSEPRSEPTLGLPPDDHVHSEWSWDTCETSMQATCAAAVDAGLRSITFTEHLDYTSWHIDGQARASLPSWLAALVGDDQQLVPPELDIDGYLACIEECRRTHPGLRIRTGLEIGEPHWHHDRIHRTRRGYEFDRVLGAMHTVQIDGMRHLVTDAIALRPATMVMGAYLDETLRMVSEVDEFDVLAHIDYPLRRWPSAAGTFDPAHFEEGLRAILNVLAASGRALEVNTVLPMAPVIIEWWCDEGGRTVTTGSDSHRPSAVGRGFESARSLLAAFGFRAGADPDDLWFRPSIV